jgi:hypothetical protein
MEYEIEEEDLLFDHATSNPSLLRPSRQPGDIRRPLPIRKDIEPALDHQMG